jgi:hypothetical protein
VNFLWLLRTLGALESCVLIVEDSTAINAHQVRRPVTAFLINEFAFAARTPVLLAVEFEQHVLDIHKQFFGVVNEDCLPEAFPMTGDKR